MIKNCPLTKWAEKNKKYAPVVLRFFVGLIFIFAGWGKLQAMLGGGGFWLGMIEGLGFPLPMFFAWLVVLVEFLGGIAILLGFGTRYASLFTSIIMAVAMIKVKIPGSAESGVITFMGAFNNSRIDLMLLAGSLSLLLSGPGPLNLEEKICKKKEE